MRPSGDQRVAVHTEGNCNQDETIRVSWRASMQALVDEKLHGPEQFHIIIVQLLYNDCEGFLCFLFQWIILYVLVL